MTAREFGDLWREIKSSSDSNRLIFQGAGGAGDRGTVS